MLLLVHDECLRLCHGLCVCEFYHYYLLDMPQVSISRFESDHFLPYEKLHRSLDIVQRR